MNENHFLNNFTEKLSELSRLIKTWNLVQAPSKGEFDKLAEKILTKLYEGQPKIKIERIIESELCVTYGLYKTEFDADKLANEIMAWWNK
jgi:hypothetical protein